MLYPILGIWSLPSAFILFLFLYLAIDFRFKLVNPSGMTSSGTPGTSWLCFICLIFQLSVSGRVFWYSSRHKQETKSVQALVRPSFRSGTPSFPLHSISQSKAMANPHSRNRENDTTPSWKGQQSPIAKGMTSGKNEVFGSVSWLTCLRWWYPLSQKQVQMERYITT